MKVDWALAISTLLTLSNANVLYNRDAYANEVAEVDFAAALSLLRRATAQAPNNYVPTAGDCPAERPTIRSATGLSPNETAWLETRRNNTVGPMRDLLGRLNITGFDVNAFFNANGNNATALPNIGIACSGGGYRALLNGAGAIAAFDDRTTNGTGPGKIGGLLQSATYLAGLSGGGWLVGSIYINNFTSVQDFINTNQNYSGSTWQFGNSIFQGPATGGIQFLSTAEYYSNIYDEVTNKEDAGYETTITDYWGRALSFQLVNSTDGGPAITFSSIADDPGFSSGQTPMPILVADGRAPGELLISGNATVYEFNPWEMGSFDPTVYGFAPLRYVGSNFSEGVLPQAQQCVRGFDNAGYIMGTSSTLFNQFLLNINNTAIPSLVRDIFSSILERIGQDNNDIAAWSPNPFYHYHNETNLNAQTERLTLVDGGEDLQNIPLHPLIQPFRNVDVIFAVDSSADTLEPGANWPNATALVATYERSLNVSLQNGTAFPAIPDQNTIVNLGLNTRPTFFGCDVANQTGPGPLIVYLPNYPYVYNSNVSTFDPSYNISERNAIIENGYNVATMGNGTRDSQWPTCVGCAILSRSFNRTATPVPDVCNQCFQRYCWDGTVNSTTPNPYEPTLLLQAVNVRGAATMLMPSLPALLFAACVGLFVMF